MLDYRIDSEKNLSGIPADPAPSNALCVGSGILPGVLGSGITSLVYRRCLLLTVLPFTLTSLNST